MVIFSSRSRVWLPAAVVACCVLLSGRASAATVFVDADAPGPTRDGHTWATAMTTLGAAIAAASPGDEVWVAAGVYSERITLREGVSVYGGFAGMESSRAGRDIRANAAILDGAGAGVTVTAPKGVTASTVLEGFTIRNGCGGRGSVQWPGLRGPGRWQLPPERPTARRQCGRQFRGHGR